MLSELDIDITHAYTPQAKGRVERLFRTLQDWLPKELKLRAITTIDQANKFLQTTFIEYANRKLSVKPKSDVDLHQSTDGYDLNAIFCLQYQRILNEDNTIVYKNKFFLLSKKQPVILRRQEKITVRVHFDKTISLVAQGQRLEYKEIEKRPKKDRQPEKKARKITLYKPRRNHPWLTPGRQPESDTSKKFKR